MLAALIILNRPVAELADCSHLRVLPLQNKLYYRLCMSANVMIPETKYITTMAFQKGRLLCFLYGSTLRAEGGLNQATAVLNSFRAV